ncbi:uncharacterized protein LOC129754064 [Uranotaenia lowii]|uniref:uncharacterized protein LOC129754064 n=1 Tax=Uranotaenia lowii TaxID=190385 RepID=UPI002478928A|nr:uncharacterized protein LOC129754064 [Uranotaenia lowii]
MSAELQAILVGLKYISTNDILGAVIMTDSKSGCELIQNSIAKCEHDEVIHQILDLTAKTGTTIQWIPGHTGVNGNEMADQLAKAGINNQTICNNKILLHDAINLFGSLSEEAAQQWYLNYTHELGKGRKFFQISNTIPKKPWHHKLPLDNREVRTLNRLLSGHDYSNFWLNKMKITEEGTCETCNVADNSDHIYDKKDVDLLKNVVCFLREIESSI